MVPAGSARPASHFFEDLPMAVSRRPLRLRKVNRSRRPSLERLEDRSLLIASLQPAGMVAWYRAENNGTDFIGGHNLTLRNGTTADQTGKVGSAITVDATSNGADTVDNAAWAFWTNVLSIDMWVSLNDPFSQHPLVGQSDASPTAAWRLQVSNGTLQFVANDGSGDTVIDSGLP